MKPWEIEALKRLRRESESRRPRVEMPAPPPPPLPAEKPAEAREVVIVF
jgi:hypothetical protein